MAFAVTGGHVSRALDFYKAPNKYFIIGGTEPWNNGGQDTPPESANNVDTFKLRDVVGLKRVSRISLVVPSDSSGSISYRNQYWREVGTPFSTHLAADTTANSSTITVQSIHGFVEGCRVRVGEICEGIVKSIEGTDRIILSSITRISDGESLTSLPTIQESTAVYGGALVERATHVYVECSLDYDNFPVYKDNGQSEDSDADKYFYRQVGLCTNVSIGGDDVPTLIASGYKYTLVDTLPVKNLTQKEIEESLGILEILDNRVPASRSADQKEQLSLIIEF